MTRCVMPSSDDGISLARLAEEIARLVNPQCWFDLKDTDLTQAQHWNDLDRLLSVQASLIRKPATGQGVG